MRRIITSLLLVLSCSGIPSFARDHQVQRPKITGVAEIDLRTSDLGASKHFYADEMGFPVQQTGANSLRFRVNDQQYISVIKAASPTEPRLVSIAFITTDAEALRAYLAANDMRVPTKIDKNADGDRSFEVVDPEDHRVRFIQYGKQHREKVSASKSQEVGKHMIHVGFIVRDRSVEDRFYKDLLGFKTLLARRHAGDSHRLAGYAGSRRHRLAGVHDEHRPRCVFAHHRCHESHGNRGNEHQCCVRSRQGEWVVG